MRARTFLFFILARGDPKKRETTPGKLIADRPSATALLATRGFYMRGDQHKHILYC